jgi:hypothetical protein
MMDNDLGCMAITEMWLKCNDDPAVVDICPPDYTFYGAPRPIDKGSRGGGIGLVAHARLNINPSVINSYNSFEAMSATITLKRPTILVLLYRPPPSLKNGLSTAEFLSEIETFLSALCTENSCDLCILGDFNLHLDAKDDPHTKQFCDILTSLGLSQHIAHPTHRKGHILDLVITRSDDYRTHSFTLQDYEVSDHLLITFKLRKQMLHTAPELAVRSLKRVDPIVFASDVSDKLATLTSSLDLESKVSVYNTALQEAIDSHAPKRLIRLKGEGSKAWYTDEVHSARQRRRQLERMYKSSGLEIHRQMWQQQQMTVVRLVDDAKSSYYKHKLTSANSKETFKIINSLIMQKQKKALPSATNDQVLADNFADYFHNKVTCDMDRA